MPVSVVILTKNEARNIRRCLESLTGFDQIMVIDSASTDGTADIARQAGAEVLKFRWNGLYPKKKEWALRHPSVRNDWVLLLDADEIMTADLRSELERLFRSEPPHRGYFIEGRFVFLGRPLRFGHRNRKLMLHDRRRTTFPRCPDLRSRGSWEVEGHYQPIVEGSVGGLRSPLLHADEKPIFHWFDRHNLYSEWEADLAGRRGFHALDAHEPFRRRVLKRLFRCAPFRPFLAFCHSYLWKLGVLDGRAGLDFALCRAFYYWQIGLKRRARMAEAGIEAGQHPSEAGSGELQQAD
ncbi:glycosyltransferase family 2 protein [Inquilinus sp. CAU 1745]|uniref:glycosyltransferase family 2 protein n=1 Tax=Inquilinus sp. CAU 1745 TaxID=3140369 RepID=UPI00325A524D